MVQWFWRVVRHDFNDKLANGSLFEPLDTLRKWWDAYLLGAFQEDDDEETAEDDTENEGAQRKGQSQSQRPVMN